MSLTSITIDHFGTVGSDFEFWGSFFLINVDEFWSQQKSMNNLDHLQKRSQRDAIKYKKMLHDVIILAHVFNFPL